MLMIRYDGVHEQDITYEELYDILITLLIERIAKVLVEAKERKDND